jgi:hypothetical protein
VAAVGAAAAVVSGGLVKLGVRAGLGGTGPARAGAAGAGRIGGCGRAVMAGLMIVTVSPRDPPVKRS